MVVQSINGRPVDKVIDDGVPKSLKEPDSEAGSYALRVALAGTHVSRRTVVACNARGCKTFGMGPVSNLVSWPLSAGANSTAASVTSASRTVSATRRQFANSTPRSTILKDAKGLILDLRNTPSGGDTDVAEPILGRFMERAVGYQRVFEPGSNRRFPQDSWVKDVDSREPVVKQPLVVLVDHWTGSMGEGMTIGFDAAKRATVVGTKMAGLLAARASSRCRTPACRCIFLSSASITSTARRAKTGSRQFGSIPPTRPAPTPNSPPASLN